MSRVTIKDIAREAGVGSTSVSRALNDQPGLSQETRQRILAVARAMDFEPNPHARSLKMKDQRRLVAVIVKGPPNTMFQVMVDELSRVLRQRGYTLETARATNAENEYAVARRIIGADKPAGVILLGGTVRPDNEEVQRLGCPFVLCTIPELQGVPAEHYSSVRVDEYRAVALQVEALVERGHRRIAYIGMPPGECSSGAVRMQAFIDVMASLGLDCPPELQLWEESDLDRYYTFEYGHRLTTELLDRSHDVTAICGASDAIALGAHKAILERGLRIPEDFAVVGFDGTEQATWVHPELATVRQPMEEMVAAACTLLFEQIEAGTGHRHIVFPGTLLARASLGAP